MVRIKDIAEKVNISTAAVSIYLNNPETVRVSTKTKKHIDEVLQELHYRPNVIARALSTKKTKIIGVMIPYNSSLFRSTFVNEALSGLQAVLFPHGYHILFLPTSGHDSTTMVKHQLDQAYGYDGLVVFGTRYCLLDDLKNNVTQLVDAGMPFVTLNMPDMSLDINQSILVIPKMAHPICFLLDSGHRNILFVGGKAGSLDTDEAVQVFQSVYEERGVPFYHEWILDGDYEREAAKSAVLQAIKKDITFTAVWCLSDTMAMGAYEAFYECGLTIPHDVSVIGTNDSFFARHMSPALTTLRRRVFDAGREAAVSLLKTIETGKAGRKIFLESELILRASVKVLSNQHDYK